ncbi:MAG: hypothetical protein JW963_21500, partial [Anaerolineales bacterium]|nr:hypothetical protein [Anaerolineales bacterium]
MKRNVTLLSLTSSLLLFTLLIFPAQAVTALQIAPAPTPTAKACHICDEGLPQPVVHAILFWMNGCPHCHDILDHVLPPLQEKYGAQLEITPVEVVSMEDVNRLYDIAATYGYTRDQVGVPFLIIGNQALIGSQQIPQELPGLIEYHLAQGGVERPSIPVLNEFLSQATPGSVSAPAITGAVVRATLFTTLDCHGCQLEVGAALGPVQEKYGEQFEVRTVDIVTGEDVEYLYQVAEAYGFPRQEVDLPLIIIGEHLLIGEQMAAELPNLVDSYLATGGVDWPSVTVQANSALPANSDASVSVTVQSDGFTLAIVIMVLMAAALIYSLVALWRGTAFPLPAWADWLIPVFIVIGISVAGYLSYVETQSVEAICGPVGDCNTVQQSRYAKLFDILPVGVLGLLGYLGLIAAWLARRFLPKLET